MAELMVFYKGAITYQDLKQMPLPELLEWQQRAHKINQEYSKEISKISNR